MTKKVTNGEAKKAALECGADLVGIASIDRFSKLPPEAHPGSIKPDTRSVIVLGLQITRGALRGIEEGTAWGTYGMGAYPIYTEVVYLFSRWLETAGWEAVPLYNYSHQLRNQGVKIRQDKPAPNVIMDMDYAAHAAGLGTMGMGKFFLTPQFGPRQAFFAVLTDAEIEPDAPFKGLFCDNCNACQRACPAGALSENSLEEAELCEGKARWRHLTMESCQVCKTGCFPMGFTAEYEPNRIGAACGRACVTVLEKANKLTVQFKNPFRKQEDNLSC